MADWLSNANEALHIKLVRAARDEAGLTEDERALVEEFHPTFTYPIFGDKETIYGYSDLKISLSLASGSLSMYLNIASSSKLPSKTADDIEGTLYKFIPPDYSKSIEAFQATVEKDAAAFKPIGEKIYTYTRRAAGRGKGKNKDSTPVSEDDPDAVVYEVYHSTWDTPGFREYHRRMQLFILLYIEGGSYIQEDEDKWEYERRHNSSPNDPNGPSFTYHFAGYSSLYPFWCWPDKVRLRLSQFVILPPYQHAGHGSALYSAIYQLALRRDDVVELTVEDPSEAFEDLRDRNDLKMLLSHDTFMREGGGPGPNADSPSGKFGPPVDKAWAEKWRRDLKIASASKTSVPTPHRDAYFAWAGRFVETSSKSIQITGKFTRWRDRSGGELYVYLLFAQVKERLYRFNYEILSQLEKDERLEKLEETFQNVREDYQRILPTVK